MSDVRLEVVPLEALRVLPGEVLILRVPAKKWTLQRIEEISDALNAVGLSKRVLIVADDFDVAVVEKDESDD